MKFRISRQFGISFCVVFIFLICLVATTSFADDPTPTLTPTPTSGASSEELQNKIKELQAKVNDLHNQGNTLSSQISAMDSQIKLTQLRIDATKQEIDGLGGDIDTIGGKIVKLEGSLENLSKALIARIRAAYETGSAPKLNMLLTSGSPGDFATRLSYLRVAQAKDRELLLQTQQAKNDYTNQKQILEDKKQKVEALQTQLEGYTVQLDKDKAAKKQLLADTQNSEANYQRLLSAAKAQLAGFGRFVASQGGASILSGQTSCDSWGCYYNQRDSQWGNNALNGTQYSLASDGCLVTSMAMILTHYGHKDITPQSINSNSSNFASYYPAYLMYTISAGGVNARRESVSMDSALSSGDPVVVGVNAYGGTHFVVVKSGSNGNYVMNDPFIPGGHDVSFTDNYSLASIFSVQKVVIF